MRHATLLILPAALMLAACQPQAPDEAATPPAAPAEATTADTRAADPAAAAPADPAQATSASATLSPTEGNEVAGRLENSALQNVGGALGASWIGEAGFLGLAVGSYSSLYGIPGGGHTHAGDRPISTTWPPQPMRPSEPGVR